MAVVAVPFILYLVRFCSSKSCKSVTIRYSGTRTTYSSLYRICLGELEGRIVRYRSAVRVPAHCFQESKYEYSYSYKKEPCLLDFPRSEGIPDTSRILMEE